MARFVVPALVLALGVAVAPALAQTPMTDPLDARDARRVDRMEQVVRELRAIVYQGRDTGKPVVVQPAETDFQLQELTRRVADMEQALSRVNGQLETTTHELDQARRDAQALKAENQSLAQRLATIEQAAAPPAATETTAAPPPGATAQESFAQARQMMLDGDYDAASRAFEGFVAAYGDNARAPEARYWLGKTLTVRGANAEAAGSYIGALRGWPQTTWAPDAVVELSRSLVALNKPADACQALAELGRRYAKAPAAVQSRAAATRKQAKCA